ncbi:MAG: hypothetical protein E6K69_04565 [Nitrospirae bacterium]|nr:MAG: hypothetical protein E6K69_04565 [Nitrospirota bacterium]
MKMLMIVARGHISSDLLQILRKNDVHAYTTVQKVRGTGEHGDVLESFFWTDYNLMILAVLPSDRADRVGDALKAFHANMMKPGHGMTFPFRIFSFPCDQIL